MLASTDWRRLSLTPVRAVDAVENDASEPVSADNHAIDIDANGDGWVRMSSGPTTTIRVRYQAGMAADWNGVPEPLRQGIVRLVAHMHLHRDGDQSPPAAVGGGGAVEKDAGGPVAAENQAIDSDANGDGWVRMS